MRKLALFVAAVLIAATAAFGQLTFRFSDWGDGPVRHLMTKDEIRQWKAVKTDAEAKAFIDLFWARRDPTPGTPPNEFHEEFNLRVQVADRQFASTKLRGALTDPGKVLILLGMPYQIASKGSAPARSTAAEAVGKNVPTNADGTLALPPPTEDHAQQVWTYAHERKPKFVPRPSFIMVFSDEGTNEWQLAHTERDNPDAILESAVKAYIVSPDLTTAPFPADASAGVHNTFSSADLKTAYDEFKLGQKTAVGAADLTWGEFVTPLGERYIAAQLYAPSGSGIQAGQAVDFFHVIENGSGEIVEVGENPMKMIASSQAAYVDKTIRLEPGDYVATFGLASGGKILSARRTPVKVVELDAAASDISPLILSNDIQPLQTTWEFTDPFIFGGLKVVPKGDGVFAPKGDLWYFIEMRNPGLNEQKIPSVQVQVEISGKTAKGPAVMRLPIAHEVAPLKGTTDRYAVGLAIPLEGFVPGDYTMKIRLVDTVLSKKYDLEKPFKISGM